MALSKKSRIRKKLSQSTNCCIRILGFLMEIRKIFSVGDRLKRFRGYCDSNISILLDYYRNGSVRKRSALRILATFQKRSDFASMLAELKFVQARVGNLQNYEQLDDAGPVALAAFEDFKKLKGIRAISVTALLAEAKQLEDMLLKTVHHPPGITLNEQLVRNLGRVRYHVLNRKDAASGQTLTSLYPQLYSEFSHLRKDKNEPMSTTTQQQEPPLQHQDLLSVDVGESEVEGVPSYAGNIPPIQNEDEVDVDQLATDIEVVASRMTTEQQVGLAEEVEYLIHENEDLLEDAGPLGKDILPFVTYARQCTEECEDLTFDVAKTIQERGKKLVTLIKEKKYETAGNIINKLHNRGPGLLEAVRQRSPCYPGLRSILSRLYTIVALLSLIELTKNAKRCDDDAWRKIPSKLPRSVRLEVQKLLADEKNAENVALHCEAATKTKYGHLLKAFKKEIEKLETSVCCICGRYCLNSIKSTSYKVETFIRPNLNLHVYCKACMRDVSSSRNRSDPNLPRYSIANNVNVAEIPEVLRNLNWIEQSLIQLVRPVRNMMNLTDIGGRTTSIRAAKGPMVLLPVPIMGTVNHVAETLPSDANLTLLVDARQAGKSKFVCLPRVLQALKYLIDNHPEYANVTINENFQFSDDAVKFVNGRGDLKDLVTDNPDEPTLLLKEDFEKQLLMDVAGENKRMAKTAFEQYKLLKNPYEPQSFDAANIDTRAFPWYFPDGKFGYDASRKKPLSKRDLIKWQLAYHDRRFACDPAFLSCANGLMEGLDMLSALGINVQLARGKLTRGEFQHLMNSGSIEAQSALSHTASKLRGHAAYFGSIKLDLNAHVAQFGAPTWFVTLNPNESDWCEVLETYHAFYGRDNVTKENIRDFIAKDPFPFVRHFHQRLRSILTNVIRKADGPLGNVIHHFFRIEYQQRGTEHVHAMFWVKDAPKSSASDDEVLKFITDHVTARMPDPDTEPELHGIVKGHQMHWQKHSKTCQRRAKVRGRNITFCRFNFPRPLQPLATLNPNFGTLSGIPGSSAKRYNLARRTEDEKYVNDYCPALTLAWKGNTDVQYLDSGLNSAISYVCGYSTKSESSKNSSNVQANLNDAMTTSEGFVALKDMIRMRAMGMLEVIDLLMGHSLCEFDSSHVFVNTNTADKRQRRLKSKNEIGKLQEGDSVYHPNLYDHFYPGRHKELEEYCLYNIAAYMTTDKPTQGEGRGSRGEAGDCEGYHAYGNPFRHHFHVDNKLSPFYNHRDKNTSTKYPIDGVPGSVDKSHRLLAKPKVPRLFWPNLTSEEETREDYFRRLSMLFIVYRKEHKMLGKYGDDGELIKMFDTFEEKWTDYAHSMKNGTEEEQEAWQDIQTIIRNQEAILELDRELFAHRQRMRDLKRSLEIEDNPEDGELELFDREVDAEAHQTTLAGMNAEQKKIFETVMKTISDQEAAEHAGLPPVEPTRLFVSGTAGTGKSYLINSLADAITLKYATVSNRSTQPSVVLAAPTGLAAVQINGVTLHALFKISVSLSRREPMKDLSADGLKTLRILLARVKLIIVDEISMVSNVMLVKIHLRLQEIKATNALFGGCNLIVFGDLLQLPPVRASRVFEDVSTRELSTVFAGAAARANMFNFFSYAELVQNMRQSDQDFATVMSHIRVQQLSADDIELLKSRMIKKPDNDHDDDDALIVSRTPRNLRKKTLGRVNKTTSEAEDDESAVPEYVANYFVKLQEEDPLAMAIFSTNAEVDLFNATVMARKAMNVVTVMAEDSFVETRSTEDGIRKTPGRKRPRIERIYQRSEYDLTKPPTDSSRNVAQTRKAKKASTGSEDGESAQIAGGLTYRLQIAEGGRVMLRRNIRASSGLVNGATGILRKIEKDENGIPFALLVKFDNLSEEVVIEKVVSTFPCGEDRTQSRLQFPIVMAFAATAHKCQGLTLKNAVISTRRLFAAGQGFVAISRIRSLEGLHLVDLYVNKLFCDRKSLTKYNALRQSIGLATFDQPPFVLSKNENIGRPTPTTTTTTTTKRKTPRAQTKNKPTTAINVAPCNSAASVCSIIATTSNNTTTNTATPNTIVPVTHCRRRPFPSPSASQVSTIEVEDTDDDFEGEATAISRRKQLFKRRMAALSRNNEEDDDEPPAKRITAQPPPQTMCGANDDDMICVSSSPKRQRHQPPPPTVMNLPAAPITTTSASPTVKSNLLLLPNRSGTECFMNSAVNLLLSSQKLRSLLFSNKNVPVIAELLRVPETKDVSALRAMLGFTGNRQEDCEEAVSRFLEKAGGAMQNAFQTSLLIKKKCQAGCESTDDSKSFELLLRVGGERNARGSMEKLIVSAEQKDVCAQCGSTIAEATLHMPRAPDFLLVALDHYDFSEGVPRSNKMEVTGVNARAMRIVQDGPNFAAKSVVQYLTPDTAAATSNGHYRSWVRGDAGWNIADDSDHYYERQLPNNLRTCRLILFEKLEQRARRSVKMEK